MIKGPLQSAPQATPESTPRPPDDTCHEKARHTLNAGVHCGRVLRNRSPTDSEPSRPALALDDSGVGEWLSLSRCRRRAASTQGLTTETPGHAADECRYLPVRPPLGNRDLPGNTPSGCRWVKQYRNAIFWPRFEHPPGCFMVLISCDAGSTHPRLFIWVIILPNGASWELTVPGDMPSQLNRASRVEQEDGFDFHPGSGDVF